MRGLHLWPPTTDNIHQSLSTWCYQMQKLWHLALTAVLGEREVTVTRIVTELNANNSPVVPEVKVFPSTAIPLSITPVFIE